MDPGKGTFDSGTESWVAYANNTIANDAGALKVTYVDSPNGGFVNLNAAADLNTDLTIGKTYKLRFKVKINTGNIQVRIGNHSLNPAVNIAETNYVWKEIIFICETTTHTIRILLMGAGEIVWIDQWYIQEWYPDGKVLKYYDPNQPLNIDTSCQVWLDGKDADTLTLDGTSVDQWDDKSGFGRDVSNGNADATRPTYSSATGRVSFIKGNSTFLSSGITTTLYAPNTVFIVYHSGDNNCYIANISDDAFYHAFRIYTNFQIYAGVLLNDGAGNANDNIHCALFNGVSSKYWINGVTKATGDVGNGSCRGINLGSNGYGAGYCTAEIMEVIVYSADISDKDRDKITGYLADKWSITSTTNFKGYILQM